MSWKRVLRAAVCLLVICCLVVNISPLNVRALTPGILISVGASLAVSAALIALGVQASSNDSTPFWDAVDQCVDALTPDGWFLDGSLKAVELQNAGMPTVMAVPLAFLEAVRSWLFGEGIVKEIAVPEGYWNYNGIVAKPYPQNVDLSVYPYISLHKGSMYGDLTVVFSAQCPYVDSQTGDGQMHVKFGGPALAYTVSSSYATGWRLGREVDSYAEFIKPSGFYWSNFDLYGTDEFNYGQLIQAAAPIGKDSGTFVSVSDGLNAGVIAPQGSSISDGYSTWAQGSATVSGEVVGSEELEAVVYPLGIPSTLEDVLKMTQEQAWTGTTTTAPPIAEGLTGSLAQTGASTFVDALVNYIATPLLSGIRALFIPDAGYLDSAIDALTSKFPFANSIAVMGVDLKQFFLSLGSEPPVIRIDLSAATGLYDYGGDMVLVDFSFYEPYKPAMDRILSAFMWLWFCWRMLLGLPGILGGISGLPGVYSDASRAGVVRTEHTVVPDHVPAPGSDAHYRAWKSWREWLFE